MFSKSSLRQLLPLDVGFSASSSVLPIAANTLLWSYPAVLLVSRKFYTSLRYLRLGNILLSSSDKNPTPTNDAQSLLLSGTIFIPPHRHYHYPQERSLPPSTPLLITKSRGVSKKMRVGRGLSWISHHIKRGFQESLMAFTACVMCSTLCI